MILCIVVLLAFLTLAVDWARVQLTLTEMRRAADAAARYGVKGISDDTAAAKAQAAAAENGVAAVDLTVTAIHWPTNESGASNAVRVTATKNLTLVFGGLFLVGSKQVSASAVATQAGGGVAGFIGLDSVYVKNNLFLGSYLSSVKKNPAKNETGTEGSIGSNGDIYAKNNEQVADVILGPDGTHNLD
ncbi:MAG: TadG family pilus assembly protein, partial [Tepidisphaeraceae bacterium]